MKHYLIRAVDQTGSMLDLELAIGEEADFDEVVRAAFEHLAKITKGKHLLAEGKLSLNVSGCTDHSWEACRHLDPRWTDERYSVLISSQKPILTTTMKPFEGQAVGWG